MGSHPQTSRRRYRRRGGDPHRARRQAGPGAARSRHRHRPHAGIVRERHRTRPRPRSVARHAGAGARPARSRRLEELQRAARRHLRSGAAAGFVRRRHHPPGAALPRRQRARHPRGGARAAAGRTAPGRRFRAARSRILARGARPSPARLRAGGGDAMARSRRPRHRPPANPPAGSARQDRRLALARPRSAPRARGAEDARGRVMGASRASRFINSGKPRGIRVSFEFFPPKTAEMEQSLWEAVTRLAPLEPNFVSVTYGAGGSTRERTHATVKRILAETMLTPAAHLTCVAATCAEIDAVIGAYAQAGVRHIVALRGDPVGGAGEKYAPHPGGYRNAADLVAGIKRLTDLEVSVSAYPEKHPDSPSVAADIDMLKAKVDAGATRAITQFFFDNTLYFRYLDRVRSAGIDIPVVPGILPVQNFKQARNFAARTGASIPDWLAGRFHGLDDDPATRKLIAAAVAAEQVLDLVDHGVTDFHFYTMNRADLVYAICHLLGVRPSHVQAALPQSQKARERA